MRKASSRHHARFHRDRVIARRSSLVRNRRPFNNAPGQSEDWESGHYHKFGRIFTEVFWVKVSHHARYRDDRTHWRRYMERNDVGTRLRLVHDWYW